MQQHLMQMQPMMASYYNTNVTTDHIQQFLDENKSLILKIVESQNTGKMSECAENQARLQRNLMYLAAIADSQPQAPSMHSQYAAGGMMQPGVQYLQHQQQQAQQLTSQSLMAARSSMMYSQQPYAALQQQQLQNQFGLSSGGSNSLHMLQSEGHSAGSTPAFGGMGFPDFASRGERGNASGIKQEMGGSSSGAHGGDGGENLYLKTGDDGN